MYLFSFRNEAELSSGGYGTVSENIREPGQDHQSEEADLKAAEEKVVAMLREGVRQLDRGEGTQVTPEYWAKLRLKILERDATNKY